MSVFESFLARVQTLLLSATAAGTQVYRARNDALGLDEMPAIDVRRVDTSGAAVGTNGERHVLTFSLACYAAGSAWETATDALHLAAHELLLADITLNSQGRGLRCTSTEMQDGSADQPAGRLTATYQVHIFVRPGDLSRAIT